MEFIYFVAGTGAVDAQMVERLGLADRLGSWRQGPIDKGPDGGGGVLIGRSSEPRPELRCDRDRQSWFPVKDDADGKIRYWFAFDTGSPPRPDDLIREDMIGGRGIKLGDENVWIIPVARLAGGGTGLSLVYGLDPATGEQVAKVSSRHERLWEMAGEVMSDLVEAQQKVLQGADAEAVGGLLTTERVLEIAAVALGTNYRIGLPEALALGLLTDTVNVAIIQVICDWKGWVTLAQAAAGDAKKNSASDG